MYKISAYPSTATSMNNNDLMDVSATNFPSAGYTTKKITWANLIIAIKALLAYVIGDGGVSVVGNLPVYNDVLGLHIIDSGIPKPGIYKETITGGSNPYVFAADAMIKEISILFISGTLSMKIGITAGGSQILDSTVVTGNNILTNLNYYCVAGTTVYVTTTGTGSFKIRIDYINKHYN